LNGFAIGSHDLVVGFRLVGIVGVEVSNVEDARAAFKKAASNADLAIMIIGEEFSVEMRDDIDRFRQEHVAPLVLEVPNTKEASKEIRLSNLISKSLGIKL
jgi:vacuolar-type H+-ATPase subunit F/Vma7